eukprot:NODE_4054_length_702_cov_30.424196_g3428_i0.p1 GENE.NODE_4054_length_702_cov_30.424196_g3428_i0~~NODE_4054_length_702_cov_30.424196_g3428_i0.p1  ORF type:complete len:66 (-),score=5.35 NODE_4054_length_702_cov_30.424196_g3428_i0:418-615(-)
MLFFFLAPLVLTMEHLLKTKLCPFFFQQISLFCFEKVIPVGFFFDSHLRTPQREVFFWGSLSVVF